MDGHSSYSGCCHQFDHDTDYEHQLRNHENDVDYLRQQLHLLASENNTVRIRIICEFLTDRSYSLDDEVLLGDKFGESALATAVARGSTECAGVLVDYGKTSLVIKRYDTEEYADVTPLHLAIINGHGELVDILLNSLDDAAKKKILKTTTSGKYFNDDYACEWNPLALAVGAGSIDIFELLLRHGSNLISKARDTGDTILHSLARVSRNEPEQAINTLHSVLQSEETTAWWNKRKGLLDQVTIANTMLRIRNRSGLTPMCYAVCLGTPAYVTEILSIEGVYTLSRYHIEPELKKLCEVSEIDQALASRKTPSVLQWYLTYITEHPRKLDLGKVAHLRRTMERKWKLYRGWLLSWFVIHFIIMICSVVYSTHMDQLVVLATYPASQLNDSLQKSFVSSVGELVLDYSGLTSPKMVTFQILELLVLLVSLVYLGIVLADMIFLIRTYLCAPKARSLRKHYIKLWMVNQFDPFIIIMFVFAMSVPIQFGLRLVQSSWYGAFFAVASLNGWSLIFMFLAVIKQFGFICNVVFKILIIHIPTFLIMLVFGFVSVGSGFYVLFSISHEVSVIGDLPTLLFRLMKVASSLDEFDVLDSLYIAWFGRGMLFTFILFTHIIIVNMLIATVNTTYQELTQYSESISWCIRIEVIMTVERFLARCLRPRHRYEQVKTPHSSRTDLYYISTDV